MFANTRRYDVDT